MRPLRIRAASAVPGLYVHIPFCRSKCAYCDFVSGVFPGETRTAYLSALDQEIARRIRAMPRPIRTVYIGGGSPSSLEDAEWERLLDLVRRRVDVRVLREWSVEVNPSQVTDAKLAPLEGLATRISLGAQTFSPALRRILGRAPEDPACIEPAAARIRKRFDLNLDLIHSIPRETRADLEEDLRKAVALDPAHLSVYALSIEEGTPLAEAVARGSLSMPDEEFQADALAIVRERLSAAGFAQYEISNFARPGRECLHNLAVWGGGEYLGVGAGASSHLAGERTRNEPDVFRYIERIRREGEAIAERERLDGRQRAGELAMLALRTREGIDIEAFQEMTGLDPRATFDEAIRIHEAARLLERTDTHIRLTEAGLDLADRVMMDFVE